MNKENFVTYKQAIALKQLGFDEKCGQIYRFGNNPLYVSKETIIRTRYSKFWNHCRDCCSAPMLCEVQEWLRSKRNYYIEVSYDEFICRYKNRIIRNGAKEIYRSEIIYNSPLEALSAGINKYIEILENAQ